MPRYPVGISTSWNAAGLDDGGEIVKQITGLGFRSVEVEYRVSEKAAAGIEAAVEADIVQVLSVHNYAPLEAGERASNRGGDKRNLSSLDESERKEAVRLTLRSLDLARKLGAQALVLHLGETNISPGYFGRLADIVEHQGVESRRAVELRNQVRETRDALKGDHLDAALRSLDDLLPHAEAAGIVLGLENRYYFHQFPLPEEIPPILGRMRSPFVHYWHDIGHAYVMEQLGFTGRDHVAAGLPEQAFGVHVHDSVFIRDHRAPGCGEIPLADILSHVRDEAIKIVELSNTVPRADVVRGIEFLEGLGLSLS